MAGFEKDYSSFSEDNMLNFKIVERNIKAITPKIETLMILDSSFNPPHKGHMKMLKTAIRQHKHKSHVGVLLELSINNVDKGMKPATSSRRLEMMSLFGQDVDEADIPIYVALTKFGKFTDKIGPIHDHFKKLDFQIKDYVFLLGFDTLERLFLPKYYLPNTVEHSLSDFFKKCKIRCLTRGIDAKTQEKWVEENVPVGFQNRIDLDLNDDLETSNISSSNIRECRTYDNCTKLVKKYICESQKDIFK